MYQDFVYTEETLNKKGCHIKEDVLLSIDVCFVGHFGNVACLELFCKDRWLYGNRNNTRSVGYILRALVEVLGIVEENGIRISEMRNIPCRLVFAGHKADLEEERVIGIGSITKDKFLLFEDFEKIREDFPEGK